MFDKLILGRTQNQIVLPTIDYSWKQYADGRRMRDAKWNIRFGN